MIVQKQFEFFKNLANTFKMSKALKRFTVLNKNDVSLDIFTKFQARHHFTTILYGSYIIMLLYNAIIAINTPITFFFQLCTQIRKILKHRFILHSKSPSLSSTIQHVAFYITMMHGN